ncbi:MAG TPA: putative glycolipid-binding domain-containing protein [Candidatus Dormibacteraeota bacterium]|nr:putative glycolipid-binding domain-containing protein [Candidatus Dormibacteraeota bacterium]
MGRRRWIMWQGLITPSLERFILVADNSGFELNGLILQADEKIPYVVRYRIQVDASWTTRELELELENGGSRTLRLSRSAAGHWTRDGHRLVGFDGCSDVDIEWSPSTNALPIRRLGLSVGQIAGVTATWIRLRSLEIERLDQSYERLADYATTIAPAIS